jgi:2-polyprenyl-6-methoxyphenol hydroxylase-like FAD-dependent oxidoreductase
VEATEVLVVGAGPTGLALACALADRGVAARVVDRQAAGVNTSRAAVVNARSLEVLEHLDVARRLVEQGVQAPRFTIRDRARTLITVDFAGLPTDYPYSLMLPQSSTEATLLSRLDELGGTVTRPKTVTSVKQDSDCCTTHFDDGDVVRSRYVVGADGVHSTVRREAGIRFEGGEYDDSFLLADVQLSGDVPDDEVILFWASAGLTVVAPLPGGVHRIVAPVAEAPEQPSPALVQEIVDTRGPGRGRIRVDEVIWGSRFRIHHRIAETYQAGRLMLAGDAAHVHSPAGGQGMNLGIQDAIVLADALAGAGPLDEYARSRRAVAQQVISLTDRLTRLATQPRGLRPLRNTAIGAVGHLQPVRAALGWRLSGLVYRN